MHRVAPALVGRVAVNFNVVSEENRGYLILVLTKVRAMLLHVIEQARVERMAAFQALSGRCFVCMLRLMRRIVVWLLVVCAMPFW